LAGGQEVGHYDLFNAVFIIPAKGLVVGRFSQPNRLRGDRQPVVRRHRAGALADGPELLLIGREFNLGKPASDSAAETAAT
jgi:hypothetical protein